MKPPPSLFARPLLGDVFKALALALGACAVLGLPLLLPTRWIVWWVGGFSFLAAWAIVFMSIRFHREMKKPLVSLEPPGGEEETR